MHLKLVNILTKNYYEIRMKEIFLEVNNVAFEKTMENLRKHRDIKPVTAEAQRNYLVPELNYQTEKNFQIIYQQQK